MKVIKYRRRRDAHRNVKERGRGKNKHISKSSMHLNSTRAYISKWKSLKIVCELMLQIFLFYFFRSILLPILLLTFTIIKVIYAQIHNTHTGLCWIFICVFYIQTKTEKQTHFHYITWNKYNFSKHTLCCHIQL